MPSCCAANHVATEAEKSQLEKKDALQIWTVTEPFLDLNLPLGEGPHYHAQSETLRFVDIILKQLHTVHLPTGTSSHTIRTLSHSVGITADIAGEGWDTKCIVAGKKGFGVLDVNTAEIKWVKEVFAAEEAAGEGKADVSDKQGGRGTKSERMRFNDGHVDTRGRFWAGSMNDFHVEDLQTEGAIYRLDTDLSVHRVIDGISIPNGMGWSLDDKTMYLTDSPSRKIYSYPYDAELGIPDVSQRKDFFTLPDEIEGVLDGCAIDVEGNLWTAVHEGESVLKLSPEGKLVGKVNLPALKITCPVFVGEDLFITTAATDDKVDGQYNGAVFRANVGVKGLEKRKFGGGEALKTAGF